jgi:tRNA pseudouridine65 synthase
MIFDILYQDNDLVVINKPNGILVHKTEISTDRVFVLQELRNQINQLVFPVHRLDRPTSGVLLFALSPEAARILQRQFKEHQVHKTYHAIVRGWLQDEGTLDYDLDEKECITNFKLLEKFSFQIPQRGFTESRYSLVEAKPKTGRFHQIRRHLRHPIVGDTTHGDGFQNKLFIKNLDEDCLFLHASSLTFRPPKQEESITLNTPWPKSFTSIQEHPLLSPMMKLTT